MSARKGVEDELQVLTVCGVGMGSSLILRMTAEVVSAYLWNNLLPASQISEVIQTVHTSLNSLGAGRC